MEDQQQYGHEEVPREGVGVVEVIELIELEEHSKRHGTEAPCARHYAFRVDKTRVVVDTPTITGARILEDVGETPGQYKLYQHTRGHQPLLIRPDQVVNLRECGVERFTTMPRDTTEGRESGPCLHLDFRLPAADEDYLNGLGLSWEALRDGGIQWLIIHDWRLPTGYNVTVADLALLIPSNYADSQIDMVYFKPHLARTDGRGINSLSTQTIAGAVWQRWSRHRSQRNPWRIGIDDVASHLGLVDEWLQREFIAKVA